MVAAYRTRVDLACTLCDEYHMAYCRPKGTFYLMIKIPEYIAISSRELALALVKKHGVAVAPGSAFGSLGENYIRLSLCCDENVIAEGLKRINRGFLALQGSAPL
jgi:aspartate/methionine/tyrosine aminotransferase